VFQKLYLQKHDKATVEQCTGCPYKYLHAQPSYYQTPCWNCSLPNCSQHARRSYPLPCGTDAYVFWSYRKGRQ